MSNEASFKSLNGKSLVLKSLHLAGRLDGLMLTMRICQRYRNETGKNLETVYTFPLAWGATLLGLDVELGGNRRQAIVLEKQQATEKFEQAIASGDSPVMVEQSAAGLYTANLGNFKNGEEATINIEYTQLLRFEQGQLRLCIPTVIAPRFGHAHKTGGLALHEAITVNPIAEYPLTLQLDIIGELSKARLSCPSHKISVTAIDQGVAVSLAPDAVLDRDVIITLDDLVAQSFAVAAPDGDEQIVLASFCPQMPAKETVPIKLKILVDCSGSMEGDSITSAKRATHSILQALKPCDQISYSRFGTNICHDLRTLLPCTPSTIHFVTSAIAATQANMGGTEMNAALLSTINELNSSEEWSLEADILLITDGEVWDVDTIIASAVSAKQRIYAIGVGSSPAESLLRELAEKTGGACELVTPNEDISAAIERMFCRMRSMQTVGLSVNWGAEPLWQSPLPARLYDGETVHLFARFTETPATAPELSWVLEGKRRSSLPSAISAATGMALARLGGAQQMAIAPSAKEALSLALKYQLVSKQSSLFLVHLRAAEEKAQGLPALMQIAQMQAAGQHGFGGVLFQRGNGKSHGGSFARSSGFEPRPLRALFRRSDSNFSSNFSEEVDRMDTYDVPAFLRKNVKAARVAPIPSMLLECLNHAAVNGTPYFDLIRSMNALVKHTPVAQMVSAIAGTGISHQQAWALLLHCLIERLLNVFTAQRHGLRLLKVQLDGLDADVKIAACIKVGELLDVMSLQEWSEAQQPVQNLVESKQLNLIDSLGQYFK